MLERFEIIFPMRADIGKIEKRRDNAADNTKTGPINQYFVPSLLLPYNEATNAAHPSIEFWKRLEQRW